MYPSVTFLVREAAEDIDLGEGRVVPRWAPGGEGCFYGLMQQSRNVSKLEVVYGRTGGGHLRQQRQGLGWHHPAPLRKGAHPPPRSEVKLMLNFHPDVLWLA